MIVDVARLPKFARGGLWKVIAPSFSVDVVFVEGDARQSRRKNEILENTLKENRGWGTDYIIADRKC